MTREEALAVAVTALQYVLDNDTDYLEREAVNEFSEALTTLEGVTVPPDLIDVLIGEAQSAGYYGPCEGSLVSDAIYYRQGEADDSTDDPDEQDDLERVEEYMSVSRRLAEMRGEAIG